MVTQFTYGVPARGRIGSDYSTLVFSDTLGSGYTTNENVSFPFFLSLCYFLQGYFSLAFGKLSNPQQHTTKISSTSIGV